MVDKSKQYTVHSVQVMTPYKKCINKCQFCISCMNASNQSFERMEYSKEWEKIYKSSLITLLEHGCSTMVITGDTEPIMNMEFLKPLARVLRQLEDSFKNIEIQTSGVFMNQHTLEVLQQLNVSVICLSVSSLDKNINASFMGIPENGVYNFNELSCLVHKNNINLRITIIMTDWFNIYEDTPSKLFDDIIEIFEPEQITLKILRKNNMHSVQSKWIDNHSASKSTINKIIDFLQQQKQIGIIVDELVMYEYKSVKIVFDSDCLVTKRGTGYRYLILMPNGDLKDDWEI